MWCGWWYRRFVWNFFRLENEHLNNCGQFRAVRDISIAPINSNDQALLQQMMDDEDGVTHRRIISAWAKYASTANSLQSVSQSREIIQLSNKIQLCDVVVTASDLQPRGRRFESRPFRFTCNHRQVVHTHVPLFTKQYKLVPVQAGS